MRRGSAATSPPSRSSVLPGFEWPLNWPKGHVRQLEASAVRAAHLYGDRRPIQDVDIIVAPGKLPEVVKLLQQQQKAVQFDGQRILWRGIKLFDGSIDIPLPL